MRKYLTTLLLTSAVCSFAAILSPEAALQRALTDQDGPKHSSGQKEITLLETFHSSSGQPSLYFFREGQDSWMAVSASDATEALLGYGDTYSAGESMPPQMQWWLQQYSEQIAFSDSLKTLYPDRFIDQDDDLSLNSPSKARRKPIQPLLTTKWNQSHPYNLYSPVVNGQKTPTGCVATALSQVMKYHNYPPTAVGTGSATAGGEEFFMDLERPLLWEDMIGNYGNTDYTQAQAEAVADLMLVAGYGCKMQYAPGGSGAYNVDANMTLVENFSYAPSAWAYYRDHYPTEVWKDMLYDELLTNGPIYYSGYGSGGHAFVCDGSNVLEFFHFNWGWGGSYDGYFKIDALNPSGIGIGGSSGGFNNGQVAILGVIPPTGNEKRPPVRLSAEEPVTCKITDTNSLSMSGGWYNMSYVEANITLSLALRSKSSGEVWYSPSISEILPSYYGYDELEFDISAFDGADGEYIAQIVTMTDTDPEWLPVLVSYWEPQYYILSKSGSTWQIMPYDDGESEVKPNLADSEVSDVYSPSGTLILRNATDDDIKSLAPGIYIHSNGSKSIKMKKSM